MSEREGFRNSSTSWSYGVTSVFCVFSSCAPDFDETLVNGTEFVNLLWVHVSFYWFFTFLVFGLHRGCILDVCLDGMGMGNGLETNLQLCGDVE